MNISQEALRDIVKTFPYTFFIGSKSWDLLSSEPPRGDSSATESRFATSWVIASPHRKRTLKSSSGPSNLPRRTAKKLQSTRVRSLKGIVEEGAEAI